MATIGSGATSSTTTIDRRPPPAGLIVVVVVAVLLGAAWWVKGRSSERATTTAPGASPTSLAGGAGPSTTAAAGATSGTVTTKPKEQTGPVEPVPWGSGSTRPRPPGTRFALPDEAPTSPEESAARRDLRVEITPQTRSIRLGDRMDVTVSLTNEGTTEYTLEGPCGLPFGAWLQATVSPADPDQRAGSLPGFPPVQFEPLVESLADDRTPWLRDGPANRVAFPGDDLTCGTPTRIALAPGATIQHHGWVRLDSAGPGWTGTSVFLNVSFPLGGRVSGHVRAHIELAVDDDGTAAATYTRAIEEIGANAEVMAWATAHTNTNMGDVPVEVRYVDGRWVVRFENGMGSPVDADVALEATTERGTGRLIDVRELRGGVGSSLDPDTEDLDPTREHVLFSA